MEFFIKKNATLPLLKLQVVKDGRSDYNNFMKLIEVASLYFSMVDTETGIPKFTSRPAGFVEKTFDDPNAEPEYYIYYQFTSNDTKDEGRYEGQFMIRSSEGVLILPIREKLFITIQDSFIADDLNYSNCYVSDFPCCVDFPTNPICPPCPSFEPAPTPTMTPTMTSNLSIGLTLFSVITSGSIVVTYNLVSTMPVFTDISLDFNHILETTGDPLVITTGLTLNQGETSKILVVTLNEDYTTLTNNAYFSGVSINPPQYSSSFTSNENTIFQITPTPTPTPTVTQTQTPSVTPTITPTQPPEQIITDAIITNDVEYLSVGFDLYLSFVDPIPPTPTQTKTPTNTPTPSPFYYYYNLLDCNNSNNKVGRSITGGLTGIYNVDVDKCYSIVGILFGSSYDYDLDSLTLVTNCNDILCVQPTPTPTPTPSVTPIICDTFTFTGNNVTTTVNSATKTSSGGWDASAYSVESYNTPVSVSFQISDSNSYLMGGFSYNPTSNTGNTYSDISYGLYIQPNFLEIYENGNQVSVPGSMTNTTSDIWKVDYNGTDVKYYKNGVLIYTSSNPVTQPLHIYFPILTQGDGVTNVCVIGTPQPSPTPTNTPTITPSPTTEPLYPLTFYVQPLSGGQAIIFDGVTYTAETTVNIQLNTFYNIEAVPTPGYLFTGWNIYGGSFSSTGQSTTVAISLTSAANLAPSYSVDPNYDALEGQLSTNLVNYQNAIDNDWVSITQEEYNNIFNNVDAVIKIGNSDEQVNTRDSATGWDTTTFGTIDANTPLTIPTGYYVVGFVAESWNQNGQVELGYTTTYHTGAPTYMGNSPNVIGGMTMFYVRKRPGNVEGAPASTNLYPVLNFISPAYPNAVLNTFGWYTNDGGANWVETVSAFQTAKIQILLTNTRSWPLPPLPSPSPTITPSPTPAAVTATTYVYNISTVCDCDSIVLYSNSSSFGSSIYVYSDINLTKPYSNEVFYYNGVEWATTSGGIVSSGLNSCVIPYCSSICDSYTNYEISNNSYNSLEITFTLNGCNEFTVTAPPLTLVYLNSNTVPITNCVRQIIIASDWNGATILNSNPIQLNQNSETLQIQANDTITDFYGNTSFVYSVFSDGTYVYLYTGPGGGFAFNCQFPLTFSGPC